MPSDFPGLQNDRNGEYDEEGLLEGPTAVSTPVRHALSNLSTPERKYKEKNDVDSPADVPLQEAAAQPPASIIEQVEEPILVTFNHPYDSDNPYQWSRFKKIRISVLVLSYSLVRFLDLLRKSEQSITMY